MTENTLGKCWICGAMPRVRVLPNNTYQIKCKKCGRSVFSAFLIMAMRHWEYGDVNYRTNIKVERVNYGIHQNL